MRWCVNRHFTRCITFCGLYILKFFVISLFHLSLILLIFSCSFFSPLVSSVSFSLSLVLAFLACVFSLCSHCGVYMVTILCALCMCDCYCLNSFVPIHQSVCIYCCCAVVREPFSFSFTIISTVFFRFELFFARHLYLVL